MNKIFKVMNKGYNFKKQFRNNIHLYNQLLKKEKIKLKIKDELSYTYAQLIYNCLKIKNELDIIYFNGFEDFKLSNQVLSFELQNLLLLKMSETYIQKCDIIKMADQMIILPIFPKRINRLYVNDPASFKMPKYQQFISDYHSQIDWHQYDDILFKSSFFNGYSFEDDYIYFKEMNVLKFQNKFLSVNNYKIDEIVTCIKNDKPLALIDLLLESSCSLSQEKKLRKLRRKYDAIK